MGHTSTPTYAVEFQGVQSGAQPVHWTPMGWNSKQAGRPTAANLAAFIKHYEASTLPGGCNSHLGVTTILSAQIVRNDGSRAIVVAYRGILA